MISDFHFNFSNGQSLTGTSDQNSTNVYDAGSAKKIFKGAGSSFEFNVSCSAIGGTTPTLRARLVGADDAALTSNVEIMADSGATPASPTAPFNLRLAPANQRTAKRYYGIIYLQGGTSPTATVSAEGGFGAQSNQVP